MADHRRDYILHKDIVLISKPFSPLALVGKIREVLDDKMGVSKTR